MYLNKSAIKVLKIPQAIQLQYSGMSKLMPMIMEDSQKFTMALKFL